MTGMPGGRGSCGASGRQTAGNIVYTEKSCVRKSADSDFYLKTFFMTDKTKQSVQKTGGSHGRGCAGMWEMPRCSVVIPAYRCEAYIEGCIRSVQRQTVADIEILVVDDCSPDNTAEIVMEHAKSDGRIRYIKQERNQGVAAARNRGVQEARSEWIAFLDSDDVWQSDKLERQFALQTSAGADLIYAAAWCMDSADRLTGRIFFAPKSVDYKSLLKGNDIVCSSVLVRREWMLKYPMERRDLHEDYLCWLRLLKDGCIAAGIEEPMVRYRLTKGSKSRDKLKAAMMTWGTLKATRIPFMKRCGYFLAYAAHGMRRYLA